MRNDKEDLRVYKVLVNNEGQYSIWINYKDIPGGWKQTNVMGKKEECLMYIETVWKDMRPLSLRD